MSNKAKNSFGISFLSRGPAGLVRVLNQILEALDQLRIQRSVDIDPLPTKDGYLLTIRNQSSATRSRTTGFWIPVQVPGEAKITVLNPGDVENIIPTIGGTLLTATTPPQLTVVTGDVYFECTMDAAGTFTAVAIKNAAAMPTNTATLRYRRLYTVTATGSAPNAVVTITSQPVTTSVSHKLCGGLSTWGQA